MSSSVSIPTLPTIALLAVVALGVYHFLVYPLFLHPLRSIPSAHWSVPVFGDAWILYQRWQCNNNTVTYAAHLKYGEVVRLGYNELCVNCVDDGIRTIYAGGWEKHKWYPQMFASYGVINMFSTMHHTPHSQKKRTMANIYSKSYVAASPQVIANSKTLLTARFFPLLQSAADQDVTVDVHDMNNAFTMDFMSAYQFGLSQSTNFTQQVEVRNDIMHKYHSRRDYEFHGGELPWLKPWSRKFGFNIVPHWVDTANEFLEDWSSKMCIAADSYLTRIESQPDPYPGNEPVVYKQYKTGLTKLRGKDSNAAKELNQGVYVRTSTVPEEDVMVSEIHSEMLDHLGAGHETSAIALTYLYWEMSKHPELQRQLREELLTLSTPIQWPLPTSMDLDKFNLPEPKEIDALPLLHAILMETLRLHAPIPGMEPRVSPSIPGGSKLGKYTGIPGNVRVSSMPYCLHRNPTVFPDPESWLPSRWLDLSNITTDSEISDKDVHKEQLREMHRWFWAFGSGGRMCIGSNLAMQEIKLIVAAIYSNYKTEIVDDEGIEEIDAYTIKPKSNRLMLRFRHV